MQTHGWARGCGEVAIWRLTTHFTFRDFIPRTNQLPIYTRLIYGYAYRWNRATRSMDEKEKNVRGKEKTAAYECMNRMNGMKLGLGKRKSYSKKAKKMGKRSRETEHTWIYRWQRIWQNIAALRAISRFVRLFCGKTNKPQQEGNKQHEQTQREKEMQDKTKENNFGAAIFFKRIFFHVISLFFSVQKKNRRKTHTTNILDAGKWW